MIWFSSYKDVNTVNALSLMDFSKRVLLNWVVVDIFFIKKTSVSECSQSFTNHNKPKFHRSIIMILHIYIYKSLKISIWSIETSNAVICFLYNRSFMMIPYVYWLSHFVI